MNAPAAQPSRARCRIRQLAFEAEQLPTVDPPTSATSFRRIATNVLDTKIRNLRSCRPVCSWYDTNDHNASNDKYAVECRAHTTTHALGPRFETVTLVKSFARCSGILRGSST